MKCDDARWQIILYLDGELDEEAAARLESHLDGCDQCRADVEDLRTTANAVDRALGEGESTDGETVGRIRSGVARQRRLRDGTRPATRLRAGVLVSAAVVLLVLAASALPAILSPLATPNRQVEVEWPSAAADDGALAIRVRCRTAPDQQPLADEPVRVSLVLDSRGAQRVLDEVEGRTDRNGLCHLRLRTPPTVTRREVLLRVRAGAGIAATEMDQLVAIHPRRRGFVWVDRAPLAPGDSVTIAGLLLRAASSRPVADEAVTLSLVGPDASPYLIRTTHTNDVGLATASVTLPRSAPAGQYRALLEHGDVMREQEVYVAPRPGHELDVRLTVAPQAAEPGETIEIATSASLPADGPAAGARVQVYGGLARDGEQPSIVGAADDEGRLAASLRVPADTSVPPGGELAVSATYRTDDLYEGRAVRPVEILDSSLRVLLVARGGKLIPGRHGVIEVLVLDGRGLPTPARLTGRLQGSPLALETGPDGVAEVWAGGITADRPVEVQITAVDDRSRRGVARQVLEPAQAGNIAVVADRGIARPGETLALDLYSDRDGLALVDFVRDGHVIYGTSARLSGGEARVYVPIDKRSSGTLGIVARWPDQPLPDSAHALLVDPTAELSVEDLGGGTEPGHSRAAAEVAGPKAGWSGELLVGLAPSEGPATRGQAHPALAFLGLSPRALELLDQAELDRLALWWVAEGRASEVRRPSRLVLAAAGVDCVDLQRATAGSAEQQAQIRDRQQSLFRTLSYTLAALFATLLIGLLVGGRLSIRGALRLDEAEVALGYRRKLLTDLVLCGVALALAAGAAAHFQIELAGGPEPMRPVLASPAELTISPIKPRNGNLIGGTSELEAHLTPGRVAPRASGSSETNREVLLSLPPGVADYRCGALAVGDDGSLGYGQAVYTVRPEHRIELTIDERGFVDQPLAAAVTLHNRSRTALRAEMEFACRGGRIEGGQKELVVAPQSTETAHLTIVPMEAGLLELDATLGMDEGHVWRQTVTAWVEGSEQLVVLSAGAAGPGGAEISGLDLPLGAGPQVALAQGRRAVAGQMMNALAPPWMTVDGPVWAILLGAQVLDVYSGPSDSDRRWRILARERIRRGVRALLTYRASPGFAESPREGPDARASALALLALSEAATWSPEAQAAFPAAQEGLLQVCFEGAEELTDPQRALAAWALARSGAPGETVLPLLAASLREGETGSPVTPETLAMAALAFDTLGSDDQARTVADRLARVAEPLAGRTAIPDGSSALGSGGRYAEAEVTALCALALERVDPKSPSRPSRQWLSRRLAELRGTDRLFGGAATNGVCGMALIELTRDPGPADGRASVESGGRSTTVDLPSDRWVAVRVPQGTRDLPSTIRAGGGELVHYVVLAPSEEGSISGAVATVSPMGDGRTGQLQATATNASDRELQRPELRIRIPAGLEPYLPDLEQALGRGDVRRFLVDGQQVRCLLDAIPPGGGTTVSFRVRAARVPCVAEQRWGASLVPAGAGGP